MDGHVNVSLCVCGAFDPLYFWVCLCFLGDSQRLVPSAARVTGFICRATK
jgi:hypothetical protein